MVNQRRRPPEILPAVRPGLLAFGLLLAVFGLSACQPAEDAPEPAPPEASDADDWRDDLRQRQPDNSLLDAYLTPFTTPPFHRIDRAHFLPALDAAIEDNRAGVDAIINNTDPAGFANTIEALEAAGADLSRLAATLHGAGPGTPPAGMA